MPRIQFLQAVELQDEHRGTDKATRYKEGQIIEVSPPSAAHWVNRGLAAVVEPEPDKPRRGRPPKAKADA